MRYYEEKGLIAPNGRRGLRRQYDEAVLERLALIALGREAGFSLDEIGAMFGADGRPAIDRAKLDEKADALDRTIRRLGAVRDALRHAAACPAPSHLECPSFRKLLRIVAHRHPARRAKSERA
ncbi:helix-turn-helix domain-containing protein [Burkholderia pseudomultivorans]|uniref:helix-turn-helix domain-containing protein n=1 Tax=Burkholderia pseudomultivorans TaxID=1207504 RepID=UPI00158B4B1F|nr:helix-turn-helix domain-containing protein [Burkholderia pseudomultivorans]